MFQTLLQLSWHIGNEPLGRGNFDHILKTKPRHMCRNLQSVPRLETVAKTFISNFGHVRELGTRTDPLCTQKCELYGHKKGQMLWNVRRARCFESNLANHQSNRLRHG